MDFNSDQSESGDVKVAYSWTILGTPRTVLKMFKGKNESNACVDFALKMADYTLQMQLKVFKPLLAKYLNDDNTNDATITINGSIFEQLPSPFDMQDLRRLKGSEFSDGALYTIISRWKTEGWVEKTGKGQWTKKR